MAAIISTKATIKSKIPVASTIGHLMSIAASRIAQLIKNTRHLSITHRRLDRTNTPLKKPALSSAGSRRLARLRILA